MINEKNCKHSPSSLKGSLTASSWSNSASRVYTESFSQLTPTVYLSFVVTGDIGDMIFQSSSQGSISPGAACDPEFEKKIMCGEPPGQKKSTYHEGSWLYQTKNRENI